MNTIDLNTINLNTIDYYITQLNSYRITHPNLTNCWLSYLGLKKRHYVEGHRVEVPPADLIRCEYVLQQMSAGQTDFNSDDLVLLMIYTYIKTN